MQSTMLHRSSRSASSSRSTTSRPDGPAVARGVAVNVLVIGALAALVVAIVFARDQPTTAVDGRSVQMWMSGEVRGQAVLTAPRATRPSVSVEIASSPSEYDIVQTQSFVLVHDRLDGTIVLLDSRNGSEINRIQGPVPTTDRPAVVSGDRRSFAVDPVERTVLTIDEDGSVLPKVDIDLAITAWVATPSGSLWLLDGATGDYVIFDGEHTIDGRLGEVGSGASLTAAGNDAAVVDPSTRRIRWLTRTTSIEVPGWTEGDALVAAPHTDTGDSGGCVAVAAGSVLSCIGPAGVLRTVTLDAPVAADDALMVSSDEWAVVARRGGPEVTIVSWADGSSRIVPRTQPSERALNGAVLAGVIVVDDPGSQFAFSIDRSGLVELDKFSRRTVVLNASLGATDDGIGSLDSDADVAGVVPGSGAQPDLVATDGVNDPPLAAPDTAVTRSGRAVTIGVLANDRDADGDALVVTSVGGLDVVDGSAQIVGGTTIRFEPPATTSNTSVTFDYRIADTSGAESQSTVTVEVIGDGSNTAPTLADDEISTARNSPVTIPVTANDADAEGDPLTITKVVPAQHGEVAIDGTGTIRFEPDTGFVGTDVFEYEAADGYGGVGSATVTVEVVEPPASNRSPFAVDDRLTALAGTVVRLEPLTNDGDPDGDQISIVGTSALANVAITVVDGSSIDVVTDDRTAGLLRFSYTISDPGGLEATADIELFVEQPSRAEGPRAVDDRAVSASIPVVIDVVANDVDPSGQQLVVDSLTAPTAQSGSATRESPTTVRFVPAAGFFGTSRFSYTVKNAAGLTATAVVAVEVVPPTGSGPIARDDRAVVFPGDTITVSPLANDSHSDRLPFSYSSPPSANVGVVRVNADDSISFVPPDDSLATYTIRYTIQDQFDRRASAVITIAVVARPVGNTAPTAINDLAATSFETATVIDVLANDRDTEGDDLRISAIDPPSVGRADIVDRRIRFTPPDGFVGVATFGYTIADTGGLTAAANVSVQVADQPAVAPNAADDFVTVIRGASATASPLTNDSDPDSGGVPLRITSVGPPSSSSVTAALSGSTVRITSTGGTGEFSVPYEITDADGLTARATIKVAVQDPPNQPPIASGESISTLAVPLVVSVLDNDIDPDNDVLTIKSIGAVSPSSAGRASIVDNRISFEPDRDFSGVATVRYTLSDPAGATATATLSLTISACPARPSLAALSTSTRFQTPVDVTLLAGGPPAGSVLTITQPSRGGSVSLDAASGRARFTPASGFNGTATFGYSVRTSCNDIASSTVTIVVNTAPTAANDFAQTSRNTAVVIAVRANDGDPDGDDIEVTQVTNGVGGQASLNGGVVTFTPSFDFVGTASFTYRIRDIGGLESNLATVQVVIENAAPVAVNDTASATAGSQVTVAVLDNDIDADDDVLSVVRTGPVTPDGAAVAVISGDGTTVSITVDADATPGTITVGYTVSDGIVRDGGVILVTVTNRPPIAAPDNVTIDLADDSEAEVDVLDNDDDPDGPDSGLELTSIDVPSGLAATRHSRSIRVVASSVGTFALQYVVTDALGASATGILTVSVIDSTPATTTTTTPPTTTTTAPPDTTTTTVPPEEIP